MKSYLTRVLASVCILFGTFASLNAVSAEVQPRMEKAIELLKKAKTDPTPIPLLEKAKEHVVNAEANKGGARPAAIAAIDAAIEISKKGGKAEKKIDKAIELLQGGVEHAK